MRRTFHNTTALVLGISLALPQVAAAQVLPAAEAPTIAATRSSNMPDLARMLRAEIDAGLKKQDLTCLMNAPKPCPPDSPQFTPRGIAVQLVDDDSFILAPAAQQVVTVRNGELVPTQKGPLSAASPSIDAEGAEPVVVAEGDTDDLTASMERGRGGPVVIPEEGAPAPADAKDAAKAARNEQKEERKEARDLAKENAAEQKDAAKEARAALKEEQKQAKDAAKAARGPGNAAVAPPAASDADASGRTDDDGVVIPEAPPADGGTDGGDGAATTQAARAATDAGAPVVVPVPNAAKAPASQDPSAADLARALDKGDAVTSADSAAPAKADAPVVVPVPNAAKAPASQDPSAADLARALDQDAGKDAGTGVPVVVPGGTDASKAPAAAPSGSNDAIVPKPAQPSGAAATDPGSADALAEASAGAKAVPEVNAKETDSAREAAAADAAPSAAALAEASAPVTTTEKTTVTEATSRQSTEDFRTDVSGAGAGPVPVVGGDGQAAADAPAGTPPVVAEQTDSGDRDNEDSDLERVLKQAVLPALAGMAVGQMLSNNREVALNTGDRVVVTRSDGSQEILKDDNALLMRPGSTVQTDEYADGSSRTVVTREDGSQVVTIRDADLRILRRTVVLPDGSTTTLIDEAAAVQPVDVARLPAPAEPLVVLPGQQLSEETLREALRRETEVDRSFTLGQVRAIPEVRALVAPIDIQAITFDTGSAAIKPDQAQALASLGRVIAESVRQNPSEVFLIEGHTDTVGQDSMNLALSDRRAESVALALTEFFQVPPENMVVQGYGEQFLKVPQEGDVRANRRASLRRITDLLARK